MAIQGHLFRCRWKAIGGLKYSYVIILVSLWTLERYSDRQKQKLQFTTTPLWYKANPHEYRHNHYPHKVYSLCATFPPLVVWVYLHSHFSDGLRKAGTSCNRMSYCPSGSSKVIDFGTNRKCMYIFLLVINSNLDPILHRFIIDTAA